MDPGSERRLTVLLGALVAAALVYTVHRAAVLRIEYWDGYEFLSNARGLIGHPVLRYSLERAPGVALLQIPAVALTSSGPPASVARLVVPHLVAALLSILTVGVVFRLYQRPFGTTLAGLGVLLFVSTPLFVHYGAHVMSDIPAAGWGTLAFALYLAARARPRLGTYVCCGLALGYGLLTRYEVIGVGIALAAAEVVRAVRARHLDRTGWIGLAGCVAAALVLLVLVHGLVVVRFFDADVRRYVTELRGMRASAAEFALSHHESWRDYAGMAPATISLPILLLAAIGLGRAVVRPGPYETPFLAWLLCVGGAIVLLGAHNEARYVFPALPALLYFSVRGFEALAIRRAGALLAVALVGWTVAAGARQAVRDRDPVFRADVERRAAELLLGSRGPGGRLVWLGAAHTLHAADPDPVPGDEFFNTFHYGRPAVQYLIDESPRVLGSADDPDAVPSLEDGDAVLKAADEFYVARTVPPGGVPPLEVWRVHLARFRRGPDGAFTSVADRGVTVRTDGAGHLHLSAEAAAGVWKVLAFDGPQAPPRPIGELEVGPADSVALDPGPAVALVLLKLDRTVL